MPTSCPPVLSIGRRCVLDGWDFRWPGFRIPYIQKPDGTMYSGQWGTGGSCHSAAKYSGPCPGPDIKSKCSAAAGLPQDAVVTCYKGSDATALESVANGGCSAFPWTSSIYSYTNSYYFVQIDGASTSFAL